MGSRLHVMTFLGPLVVLGLAAVSLGVRPAAATVVVDVGFDEQCASAERIFVGTVDTVESRRNPSAPRYFETIVTFSVDDSVVGDTARTISLRFTGGQIGDERQSIDGMPEFARGERYVVFVEPAPGAPLVSPIVGFNQGLYSVVPVKLADGTHMLVRDRLGHPIDLNALTGRAAATTGEGAVQEPELATFLMTIHAVRPR